MKFRTLMKAGGLAVGAGLLFAGTASAEEKAFSRPTNGGKMLDYCLTWSTDCGKPAADAFCESKGYQTSKSFVIWQGSGRPTKLIGSGEVCEGSQCDTFKQIVCSKGGFNVEASAETDIGEVQDGGGGGGGGGGSTPPKQVGVLIEKKEPDKSLMIDSMANLMAGKLDLGGQVQGDLSAVMAAGRVYVVGRGMDNKIWYNRIKADGTAMGWQPDPASPVIKLSPSCASFSGSLRCAAVTEAGNLISTNLKGEVLQAKGDTKASPSLISSGGWMGMIVRALDNQLSINGFGVDDSHCQKGAVEEALSSILPGGDCFVSAPNWVGWTGPGLKLYGAPACTVMGADHVDCYSRSSKNEIVQNADILRSKQFFNHGGETEKRPQVIRGKNSIRLLVKGTDGFLWHKYWDTVDGWRDWQQTDVKITSAPACQKAPGINEYWCFDNAGDTVMMQKVKFAKASTAPEE